MQSKKYVSTKHPTKLSVLWIYTKSEAQKYISVTQARKLLGHNGTILTNHVDIVLITEVIQKCTDSECALAGGVLNTFQRRILRQDDPRVAWLLPARPADKATEKQLEPVTPADTATEKQLEPATPTDTATDSQPEIPPSDSGLSEDPSDSSVSEVQRAESPRLGDANDEQDDNDIETESSQPEAPSPTGNLRQCRRGDGEEEASKGDVRYSLPSRLI